MLHRVGWIYSARRYLPMLDNGDLYITSSAGGSVIECISHIILNRSIFG